MTTTTEEAPQVASVGDRVRITELDEGWASGLRVGDVGTVTLDRGADNTCCAGNHRFTITRDDGNKGFARAVEPVTESVTGRRPGEFRVGDRVRLESGSHYFALGGVYTGTVVEPPDTAPTVLRRDYLAVKLDRPAGPGAFGDGIYALRPDQIELIEDEPEPAPEPMTVADGETENRQLRERAERAERELEAFRTKVRDAVIEEAERRGWCNETDDWLVSIGLEPRKPQEQDYTVYVSVSFRADTTVTVPATETDIAANLVETSMVIESLAGQLGIPARYLHDLDPDWEIDDVELEED